MIQFVFAFLISLICFSSVEAAFYQPQVKLYYKKQNQWVEIQKLSSTNLIGISQSSNITYKFDFMEVVPGLDRTIQFALGSPINPQSLSTANLSGSSDMTIINDGCSGAYVPQYGLCYLQVVYAPSDIGFDAATIVFNVTNHLPFPAPPDYFNFYIVLKGSSFEKPEVCSEVEQGSIVKVSKQVLGEVVPVVGTDLSLYYSSEFTPEYQTNTSVHSTGFGFNFEGWTLSQHHYYDVDQHRLFLGTGSIIAKEYRELSSGDHLVVGSDEVYIFSPTGKHLETRTILTGAVKYTFGYDSNSRLITMTDAFSNVTTITRDGTTGKATSITGPYGQVTTLTVGANGLFDTITNPNSETYEMTYKSSTGLLETFTKPGGQVSTFTYDSNGRITKDLGHGGQFWEIILGTDGEYTNSSQMNRTTYYSSNYEEDGSISRFQEEPSGFFKYYSESVHGGSYYGDDYRWIDSATTQDERFGASLHRLETVIEGIQSNESTTEYGQTIAYGSGITPDHFNFSSITKTVTTSGRTTTEFFDNVTKMKTITTPEGATTSITLNSHEQPTSMQVGSDTATTLTYDSSGRLSTTIQGSVNQKTYAYNSAGFLQTVTNALSQVTSYVYDLAGRVASITLPDARVIQYAYDDNGNITGVTPPSRPIHNFTFNAFELPSEYQPPTLSGVLNVNTQYSYNMDKQLTQITRPTGQTASYNYDSTSGLLTSVVQASSTNSIYYYDYTHLIHQVASTQSGMSNYFDYYGDSDRLLFEELRYTPNNYLFARLDYEYDTDHRLTSRILQGNSSTPTSTTAITYNDDDAPVQIGDMDLTYDYPSGRLESTTLDKVSDQRTYDAYGNLDQYEATYNPSGGPAVSLYSYDLTRDTLHRITGITETIQGVTTTYAYTYDSVGRLSTVIKNGLSHSSYTYDTNGNRTSGVRAGNAFTATFDDQDRQLTYNSKTFSYNENGDLTQKVDGSSTTSYTYDALGKLLTVTLPSSTLVNYYYNGKNQFVGYRVGGVLFDIYINQDDYKIAAHLTTTGTYPVEYRYGTRINTPDQVIRDGNLHRIITDHLGSPRLVVRVTDGVILQRMDYDEWGVVLSDTNPGFQKYGFAGGIYLPEDQLVKFGARYYDAETGRWTTKDPILFEGGDVNLYGYTFSDPINFIDPSGLSSITYNRGAGTITVRDRNGNTVGTYPAGNNTARSSNGPWPNGTYPYSHHSPHPRSGPNGPFGSNGNFVFNVPGRPGMGVHSGRQGPSSVTMGCIRTTDEATDAINNLNNTDPLTSITVGD